MSAQTLSADSLLGELQETPRPAARPTIAKIRYTHVAMIDLIVSNPWISQGQLAAHFGYSQSWISIVISSDAFQAQLAKRRDEIIDPAIKATVEEKFRALVHQSLDVLRAKLEAPVVEANVALRAAELGAKALGIGGHAPPPPPAGDRLEKLAERLLILQSNVRQQQGVTYNGQVIRIEADPNGVGEELQSHPGQPAETAIPADRGSADSTGRTDGG